MSILDTLSDTELCARAVAELPYTTTAFEVLVRRHQSNLYRFCRRILRDQDRAEDATQDTLIRMYHALSQFEGRADFKTWLFTIARNVCLTCLRRMAVESQRREDYVHDQELARSTGSPSAGEPDLDELLSSISVDDREILSLRFVAGLSLQEIADSYELTLSAAKMRLYRAIENLRESIRKAAVDT
ncbi:MAG: sigma-70 family RNA polymerase sigma factor [Steroidobacteraceae bacterium]